MVMVARRDTHIRINKGLKSEFDSYYGDKILRKEMTYNDIVRMSWELYKGTQKMGRFLYGNAWKKK